MDNPLYRCGMKLKTYSPPGPHCMGTSQGLSKTIYYVSFNHHSQSIESILS